MSLCLASTAKPLRPSALTSMCTQLGLQLFIRAADFPLQQLAFDIRRISYRAKIFYFSGCVVVVLDFSRTKLWYTADPFLSSFITLYPLFYISYTTHETHKTRHMPGPGKVNERPRPLAFAGARWWSSVARVIFGWESIPIAVSYRVSQ